MPIGRPAKTLKIFAQKPDPTRDTFEQGLLLEPLQADIQKAIILYAPDVQHIGTLDNTDSDASTTYSKSVTSGFTFSMAQSIGVSANVGVNLEIVKAEVTVSLNLTFTQQWNKSTTETYQVSVPAGRKSFIYQGYLLASVLEFHTGKPESSAYTYAGEEGRFLSNVVRTTKTALPASH